MGRARIALFAFVTLFATTANSAETGQVLVIRANQFQPAQIDVPQGVKVKLTIRNEALLPAEFESYDLSREIVVAPGGQATLFIGPLKPGRYEFFNDFDRSMKGVVVAKPAQP